MDIKNFANIIKVKKKELDDIMRRRMPVITGRMAKDHFQDNFRQGGFVNGGLHPWPKTKREQSGGAGADDNYSALLSSRNHLFSSIKYVPGDYRVRVANELFQYAKIQIFESNSQQNVRRYTPMKGCFSMQRYKFLKAIHNTILSKFVTLTVVSVCKDTNF